jgi:type II secretory pathway component PulF
MLYAFTARDGMGAAHGGTMEAPSGDVVQQKLRAEGKYPTSIRPATGDAPEVAAAAGRRRKLSRADVINLATQISMMVETGVTLSDALDCIAAQCDHPRLKAVVTDLSRTVREGQDFSTALARHPSSFPRVFIALIRASEKSGQLSRMLQRAVGYLRDEQATRRKVKGALTYPGIMLAFAVLTTVFLLAFVLPKFTVIYANKKAVLPIPTRVLLAMSGFVVNHWLALLIGTIGSVVGLIYGIRTPSGRSAWHTFQLRVPLLGAMYRKLHLSRGMRMIGTLASAGVSLMDCVHTAKDLCDNVRFTELWDSVLEQIQSGKQFSEPMFASALVPRSVSQMLHSAERSGKLATVLEQVSGYAEQELKEQIAELTRYIEPAMIVIMGVIIGGVAMAMLLPIFTISRVVAS